MESRQHSRREHPFRYFGIRRPSPRPLIPPRIRRRSGRPHRDRRRTKDTVPAEFTLPQKQLGHDLLVNCHRPRLTGGSHENQAASPHQEDMRPPQHAGSLFHIFRREPTDRGWPVLSATCKWPKTHARTPAKEGQFKEEQSPCQERRSWREPTTVLQRPEPVHILARQNGVGSATGNDGHAGQLLLLPRNHRRLELHQPSERLLQIQVQRKWYFHILCAQLGYSIPVRRRQQKPC